MDLREFAKRTLNLKNHTGTISIIGKSLVISYLSAIFFLDKGHLQVRSSKVKL